MIDLAAQLIAQTKAKIFDTLIALAAATGLDVESFESGDPTRALYSAVANRWADWEKNVPEIVRGHYLGLARGVWLRLKLEQDYNITYRTATYAECVGDLVNSTTEDFGTIDAEALLFTNSTTGAEYRNVDPITLGPSATASGITVRAVEPGTDSNALAGDIDTISDPQVAGLSFANTTAALASDDEAEEDARARGQAKLGALSPNGPRDVYQYVILSPEYQPNGVTNVEKVRTFEDGDRGKVYAILRGASGAVAAGDVTQAQAIIDEWCEPTGIDARAYSAVNKVSAITYSLSVYDSIGLTNAEIETKVAEYLAAAFRARPPGGDILDGDTNGKLYVKWIEAQIIQAVAPYGFKVAVTLPAADVTLNVVLNPGLMTASVEVSTLGTITPTITQTSAPR